MYFRLLLALYKDSSLLLALYTDLDPKLGDDALKKSFYFIAPANGLGLPAVALSTGVSDGIPTGIQIYADLFRDDLALLAAEIIEKEKPSPSPINPK